jgi:hypothetical protein
MPDEQADKERQDEFKVYISNLKEWNIEAVAKLQFCNSNLLKMHVS